MTDYPDSRGWRGPGAPYGGPSRYPSRPEEPESAGYLYQSAVSQPGNLYPGLVALQHGLPPEAYQRYSFPNPGPLSGQSVYPGHGLPPRRGEDRPGLSPFGRLVRGQPLGKRSVLIYSADRAGRPQPSAVTILKVEGDDMDAQPVCVTIAPPMVIPLPFSQSMILGATQNLTGEQTNLENRGDFPGTEPPRPVVWPPFDVVVEWGVGGASTRMSVDVINGVVVPNLAASWIRVHAVAPAETAIGGTSAAYVIYAFVGPGPAVGSSQRTVWAGPLQTGEESGATKIPVFARRVYAAGANVGSPAPAAAITAATIRLWQDAGRTQPVANYVISGSQPLPFEVPNGAMYASIVNNMSVAARFGIIYSLSGGV